VPAFPFLTLLAALGIHVSASNRVRCAVIACLLLLAATFAAAEYGRFQECYLNEAVTACDSADRFETEYEVVSYLASVPWLNAHAPAKVYTPIFPPYFEMQNIFGSLSQSVQGSDYEHANYVALIVRQGEFNDIAWNYYLHRQPVYVIGLAGKTAVLSVYRK
jgi:hypothetical protein